MTSLLCLSIERRPAIDRVEDDDKATMQAATAQQERSRAARVEGLTVRVARERERATRARMTLDIKLKPAVDNTAPSIIDITRMTSPAPGSWR